MKVPAIYYYVDHTSKFEHNSGIQRCVRSIAKALIELRQPLIPVVWDRSCQQLAPATQSDRSHLACWNGPPSQAWSQWKDVDPSESPWLLIVELVSGPNNPSREQLKAACHGMRIAWVFHDAIPVRWAHLYGSRAQQAATSHATYMRSLASYERVFCNSHTSRRHLLDFLTAQGKSGAKEQLSHILSLPLAEELSGPRCDEPPPEKPSRQRLQLLCVSTLEPRKNHIGLLKALAWLQAQGLRNWQLEFVGWGADTRVVALLQRACQAGLPLRWHGRADDNLLADLYARADFTVYPSLEEGFGLPVAESLWHRRPCLCGGEGALAERAADGGCITVNTADWRSIAAGLERLLRDSALRTELARQAGARSFRRWHDVAADLLKELT